MIIYLVRHGQSEGNISDTHHTPETPLTQNGIKQAEGVAKRFKNIKIDYIYSSDYKRALQTAEVISKEIPTILIPTTLLRECGTPSKIWGKKIDDPDIVKIKRNIDNHFYKGNFRLEDEETFKELKLRANKLFNMLLKKHKNQNIILVSHSSYTKFLISFAIMGKDLTPNQYLNFREHMFLKNTGISIIEWTEKFGWTVNSFNDTNHL